MDGLMMGTRNYETATLALGICKALPKRMHDRTREVTAVHVPAADRRKGYARELLERVTAEADEAGITLIIMPSPFDCEADGMTHDQLAQWYNRRFGWQAIQAKPLIMARMPGSTPRYVTPISGAMQALLDKVAA